MINDFEKDTFTIREIFKMNDYRYPFWITPWRTVHSVVRITHQTMARPNRFGPVKHKFHGEIWTVDKQLILDASVTLDNDLSKGWLPLVDSQSN